MALDQVILALQSQVGCYQKLAKLAELQHLHVQKGQTDSLLDVLQRRQEVLDQILLHERTIGPAKKGWGEYRTKLSAADLATAEQLLAETRRLLEQITSADRNDSIVLQQRKASLGLQINKATIAKTVNRNYAAAAYGRRQSTVDVHQ